MLYYIFHKQWSELTSGRGMKVVVQENCIDRSCAFYMSFSLAYNEYCILFDVYVSEKSTFFSHLISI